MCCWTSRNTSPTFGASETPAMSTPARNRTRNFSFEARDDFRFTTEATEWKARESPQPDRVIPDGLEPSFPACDAGVVAAGPRDLRVAEVGIEPTISHQALDLAALPLCVLGQQLRRSDSNRRGTAYETVLETRLQSTPQ